MTAMDVTIEASLLPPARRPGRRAGPGDPPVRSSTTAATPSMIEGEAGRFEPGDADGDREGGTAYQMETR